MLVLQEVSGVGIISAVTFWVKNSKWCLAMLCYARAASSSTLAGPTAVTANSMHVAQLLARALCLVLAVLEHWVLQLSIQESLNVQSQFCHSGLTTCSQSLCFHTQLVLSPACDKHITCKCYLWPWCSCPSQPGVILSCMGQDECCVISGRGKIHIRPGA